MKQEKERQDLRGLVNHLWTSSCRRNVQINETTSSAVCNSDKLAMGAMDEKAIAKKNPIR